MGGRGGSRRRGPLNRRGPDRAPPSGAPAIAAAAAALTGCWVEAEAASAELPGGGGKLAARGRVGGEEEEEGEEEVWTAERTSAAVTWAAGDIARRAGAGLQSLDPGQPI